MKFKKIHNINFSTYLILAFSFFINVGLIIFFPKFSGDGEMFLRVAENIFSNNCISISIPETGKCLPHWGGNQGPLYPVFISMIWKLLNNNLIVLLTQQLILSLSMLRFYYVIRLITNIKLKYFYFFIFFFSPLSFGWSRFLLTESLSISLVILLYSELILCNYSQKIKIFRTTLFFSLGFFLRYDFLLWSMPIILITFFSIGFRKTFFNGVISIIIFITLVSLWSYRNYTKGLSIIPGGEFNSQYITLEENQPSYKGYLKWVETWSWNNYMYAPAVYPLSGNNYKNINIHKSAYDNAEEKNKVTKLLNILKNKNGERYSKSIDKTYLKLANQKASLNKIREYLVLPAQRALFMMFNPFTSMGIPSPISSEDKNKFINANFNIKIHILSENFFSIFLKIVNLVYRIMLYMLFIYLCFNYFKFDKNDKILIFSTLLYFILRTTLFSQVYFTATRHLLQPLIMMEMTILIIFLKNKFFFKT